jgi:2-oxo-hept-3-ene-1,7-dioate hydratase
MLSKQQIADAADQLYQAEIQRQQIRALTLSFDMDMEDAYAVQKGWVDRKLADGEKVIGYKIGLTSRTMQLAMNINTPDYGVLTDAMQFASGSDIRAADFLDPRIECEFAFVLKKPLSGENVSLEQVMDATAYVQPALELISARSLRVDPETGYTRNVYDTIADNAANAGIICGGKKMAPEDIDLKWAGAALFLNDDIEDTGLGAAVMGHPGHGIRWVCRRFAPHGIGLEPGQVILSGSFTRPIAVKAEDHVFADYGEYGSIQLNFV